MDNPNDPLGSSDSEDDADARNELAEPSSQFRAVQDRWPPDWPSPPTDEAFHGIAGEFVHAVEPQTEADPAGILLQLMVGFGNAVGRKPHFRVESDLHFLNLNAVLVGRTSRSRKGTSWGHVERLVTLVDPRWGCRIASGLSSGEGLIHAVRDETIDSKGELVRGIDDKRLMVVESEFASPLQVIKRPGNTLSPTVRDAWDRPTLQVLAKNTGEVATGAHISIIGHITEDEVLRLLKDRELANGFANRFIWFAVHRSRLLPDGGRVDAERLSKIHGDLKAAFLKSRTIGEVSRSPEAAEMWMDLYGDLSAERDGLVGAVTARAEAQVTRLSCIYALIDRLDVVQPAHLSAAMALWTYSVRSVEYIFGRSTGDGLADRIRSALRRRPEGMTRSEIRDLFSRNVEAAKIDVALSELVLRNLAVKTTKATGGRPAELWLTTEDESRLRTDD